MKGLIAMSKLIDDKHAVTGKWYLVNGTMYMSISDAGTYTFHENMYKIITKQYDATAAEYPWFWYPRGMCDAIIPEDGIANLSGPSLLTEWQKGVIASEFEARNMPDWVLDEHYELDWTLANTPDSLKKAAELFFKDQLAKYTGRKLARCLNENKET